MLGQMAETYHQPPSQWFPWTNLPLHQAYWFDRAIWRRSQLPANPAATAKVVNGALERPIGLADDKVIRLFGDGSGRPVPLPWVGGDEDDE